MKIVLTTMVRYDMQLDQKDEIDCTIVGRGDEGSKLPTFGTVDCYVDAVPMLLAKNKNVTNNNQYKITKCNIISVNKLNTMIIEELFNYLLEFFCRQARSPRNFQTRKSLLRQILMLVKKCI